jgi:ElaB/YqjD/DUF883 family membrane-anchored ribosome-binding protein
MGIQQTTRPFTPSQAARFTRDTAEELLPRIEEMCRQRPWTAIAFGVALGFLVRGLLQCD